MIDIDINNLSGVLFKNENKKTENHPDYQGNLSYDGTKIAYISAWLNTSKTTGKKFMSLKLKEIENFNDQEKSSDSIGSSEPEVDDDIPF
jgi:uncharacterized protein (DUF736 family)